MVSYGEYLPLETQILLQEDFPHAEEFVFFMSVLFQRDAAFSSQHLAGLPRFQ